MYFNALSQHPHFNSKHLMSIAYEIYYLIQSRSITCASLPGSTMSLLVDPMTRDNLDTNIITHDRNLIIMNSS